MLQSDHWQTERSSCAHAQKDPATLLQSNTRSVSRYLHVDLSATLMSLLQDSFATFFSSSDTALPQVLKMKTSVSCVGTASTHLHPWVFSTSLCLSQQDMVPIHPSWYLLCIFIGATVHPFVGHLLSLCCSLSIQTAHFYLSVFGDLQRLLGAGVKSHDLLHRRQEGKDK